MELDENAQLGALEAILFLHGEAIGIKEIAKYLALSEAKTQDLLVLYEKELERGERGLILVRVDDKVQLATKAQFAPLLAAFIKETLTEDLSPASAETLALVAYFGPIPRTRLDSMRGVNSTFTLRNLLIRGLVDRVPDPQRSNAYVYNASFDLMRHLGLTHKDELPEFDHFQKILHTLDVGETPGMPMGDPAQGGEGVSS